MVLELGSLALVKKDKWNKIKTSSSFLLIFTNWQV